MDTHQYVLPKIGVATNQIELKKSQHQLLQENYQQAQYQKHSLTDRTQTNKVFVRNQLSNSNPFKSSQKQEKNLILSRANSLSKLPKNIHSQIIKASLSHELANQIAIKEQLKKYKRQQEIQMQQNITRHNKLLEQKQKSKHNKFHEDFKQQANYVAKLRQLKKQQERYCDYLQKSQMSRQYRDNNEMIEKKLQGVVNPQDQSSMVYTPKRFSTIGNNNRVSQSSLSNYNYNNPQTISIIPIRSHHKPSYQQSTNLKSQMKQTLLQQIKLNSQRRMSLRLQRQSTKYVDDKYKLIDNPITNPIDLKIAKDNPYVIRQLLGVDNKKAPIQQRGIMMNTIQTRQNNKRKEQKITTDGIFSTGASYLSRRGSSSLTRLLY